MSLYEHIVIKAKELNLKGATVVRGIMGFELQDRIHKADLLSFSFDLPIILEFIDREDNINKLLQLLDETIKKGFVTLENVKVIKYRPQ